MRQLIRARHYSPRTEKAYVGWMRRYIVFQGKRHPEQMGAAEVGQFLAHLATECKVSASTQNQAFSALLFLYRDFLGRELTGLETVVRAKQPTRLPVVLTRNEVAAILGQLHGVTWLMASLMYGAGLRLLECARLRVKDVDFERGEITVRDGKGGKDRVTVLPATLKESLVRHLQAVRRQHEFDLRAGAGSVELPDALDRKYPRASWDWAWQWVFPATRPYLDRKTGRRRRHHLHETVVQRAFAVAVRTAQVAKSASLPHPSSFLRHPPPGGRLRPPHHTRAPGPQRRHHNDGLYPRPQPRWTRREESPGPHALTDAPPAGRPRGLVEASPLHPSTLPASL